MSFRKIWAPTPTEEIQMTLKRLERDRVQVELERHALNGKVHGLTCQINHLRALLTPMVPDSNPGEEW